MIECLGASLTGTVSAPPDTKANVTSWTVSNCQARPTGYGSSIAKVKMLNLPSIEALDLNNVRLKRPTSGPFKIWVEYRLGEFGNTCYAEVELDSGTYSYSSDGSTNVLFGNGGQFGSFSPEVDPVSSGCLRGNVADSALAEFEISYDFPKPQFQIADNNVQIPNIRITKPPSSSLKTNARLFGRVTPNGASTTYYFKYGLTSSYGSKAPPAGGTISSGLTEEHKISAMVEGLQPGTTYHYQLVATNSKGTTPAGPDLTFTTPVWSIQPTPNASEAYGSLFTGIGCEPSSTNMCMAVGGSFPERLAEINKPLAARWNGSSWTLTSPEVPGGATASRLSDVACPSTNSCTAVGKYSTASGTFGLIELWNGASWAVQPSANPSGATNTALQGTSCASTSACVAVGSAVIGGVTTAIIERWNGSLWSLDTVPAPSGAKMSEFRSVDCVSASSCMAVGQYQNSEGWKRSLSAIWNGGSWELKSMPEPAGVSNSGLNDLDCSGAMVCTAGGGYYVPTSSVQRTLIERWTGTGWTLQESPNPPGSETSVLNGVACTSSELPHVGLLETGTLSRAREGRGRWLSAGTEIPGRRSLLRTLIWEKRRRILAKRMLPI